MTDQRSKQNWAAFGGIVLVLATFAMPWGIAKAIDAKNESAAAGQVTEYKHVNVAEIGAANIVFYNRTGDLQKVDIKSQLADVPNANSAGFEGIEIDVTLSESGSTGTTSANTVHAKNNTDWTKESYVELTLTNSTAQSFLKNGVNGFKWTFRALSSGEYLKDHQDTVNVTKYHLATDKHFRVETRFVYGPQVLAKSPAYDIQTGSKVGDNYTASGTMNLVGLAKARLDAKEATTLAPQNENSVVVRVYGYYKGNNALASDDVILSMQFTKPNSPGILSYEDGYALFATLGGLALAGFGLLASPLVALSDIHDRSYGGPRFQRRS